MYSSHWFFLLSELLLSFTQFFFLSNCFPVELICGVLQKFAFFDLSYKYSSLFSFAFLFCVWGYCHVKLFCFLIQSKKKKNQPFFYVSKVSCTFSKLHILEVYDFMVLTFVCIHEIIATVKLLNTSSPRISSPPQSPETTEPLPVSVCRFAFSRILCKGSHHTGCTLV